MSSRCMTPSVVSCNAPSSAFWRRSSSVRSATRCSRPSNVSRSCEVMSLNAIGQRSHLVLRRHRRLAGEIARGDRRRRLGDGEDRAGNAPGRDVDGDAEQRRHDDADAGQGEGEPARGRERGVLALLRHERCAELRQPAVDADHRDTGVALVEAAAVLLVQRAVDASRGDAVRVWALAQARVHKPPVRADEICLAGRAEALRRQHDPVDALEVEVRGDDGDPLSVAVEERRGHGDRGLARERRHGDRLHVRAGAAARVPVLLRLAAPPRGPSPSTRPTLPLRSRSMNSSASAV